MRYWKKGLDSTEYCVECEKEALKESLEECSLAMRTK